MEAITFDGLKCANVELDLVELLFLKFGRNTLLSSATCLAKK